MRLLCLLSLGRLCRLFGLTFNAHQIYIFLNLKIVFSEWVEFFAFSQLSRCFLSYHSFIYFTQNIQGNTHDNTRRHQFKFFVFLQIVNQTNNFNTFAAKYTTVCTLCFYVRASRKFAIRIIMIKSIYWYLVLNYLLKIKTYFEKI